MKKSLILAGILMVLVIGCTDNSPADRYAEIINHVIAELQKNTEKPQIAGQNIVKYLEEKKDTISQLQETLANFDDDQMFEYNNAIAIPSAELLNLVKGNQDFGQDQNIVNSLFLLKIIE